MPRYEVIVTRTETISYEIEATSREDAENRYLSDGEETASRTGGIEVESVEEI